MLSSLTLPALAMLKDYRLSGATRLAYDLQVSSITKTGSTIRLVLSGTPSLPIRKGQVVIVDAGTAGTNAGAHLITAFAEYVPAANPNPAVPAYIEYDDADGTAEATDTGHYAEVWRMPVAQIDSVMQNEVIPYIENLTRLSISGATQYTEFHSGQNTQEMMLDRKPIVSLDSIQIISQDVNTLIDIAAVELIASRGVLRIKQTSDGLIPSLFPQGKNNIKVTFTAGYSASAIPGAIIRAATLLCAANFLGQEANYTGGGTSLSVEGYSRSFAGTGKFDGARKQYMGQAMNLLRPYRTGVVGN